MAVRLHTQIVFWFCRIRSKDRRHSHHPASAWIGGESLRNTPVNLNCATTLLLRHPLARSSTISAGAYASNPKHVDIPAMISEVLSQRNDNNAGIVAAFGVVGGS